MKAYGVNCFGNKIPIYLILIVHVEIYNNRHEFKKYLFMYYENNINCFAKFI